MKLPENRFKQAIQRGRLQIGIWNSLCSEIAAEVLATAGYDWALLDMEHSPSDLRTALHQLQAYQAGDTVPVVIAGASMSHIIVAPPFTSRVTPVM